ncbi:hypothetical protein A2U01_0067366, partial [Trifolium medium]|nr:hypothetical protein [Trifolium medium]
EGSREPTHEQHRTRIRADPHGFRNRCSMALPPPTLTTPNLPVQKGGHEDEHHRNNPPEKSEPPQNHLDP